MTTVNIQPFTLPPVTRLLVQNLGEPFAKEVAPGVVLAFRRIRYELRDDAGRIRELDEVDIPEAIYNKCGEFVMGAVSENTLTTLNTFFQQAGWVNMVAVNLPEE